jgi:hypothetical protein
MENNTDIWNNHVRGKSITSYWSLPVNNSAANFTSVRFLNLSGFGKPHFYLIFSNKTTSVAGNKMYILQPHYFIKN